MSSHGYNYFDRDRDRNHVLANVLRDSDQKVSGPVRSLA